MTRIPAEPQRDGMLLSAAVKAVRKHRGLKAADVAQAMNMPVRTYEHFEGGHGRINLDYVHRFCAATDSDPAAVLAAVAIGSAEFARRCADNKLMMIFTIALQEFDRDMGERIRNLDARELIAAFSAAFNKLDDDSRGREAEASSWYESGVERLKQKRPKPGR
jgi:transcriptional regulator with XRE-family HTH domain